MRTTRDELTLILAVWLSASSSIPVSPG